MAQSIDHRFRKHDVSQWSSLEYPYLNKMYCSPFLLKAKIFFLLKNLMLIKMSSRFETTDNEKLQGIKYLKLDF